MFCVCAYIRIEHNGTLCTLYMYMYMYIYIYMYACMYVCRSINFFQIHVDICVYDYAHRDSPCVYIYECTRE